MPITFDINGLQAQGDGMWVDPASGDAAKLMTSDGPPFEAEWMSDITALRRGFAGMFADAGCLIECELIPFGGARAVFQLVKVPLPNAPSGQVFMAIFTLTKAPRYAQLLFHAAERGTTGMRESMIMMRLGMPSDWVLANPFDPNLRTALPFHRGDDPAWDAQFPDHPLTRARRFAGHVMRTARVDPGFAALPELGSA